jgi:hypothetical protein
LIPGSFGGARSLDDLGFFDFEVCAAEKFPRAMLLNGLPADSPVLGAKFKIGRGMPDVQLIVPMTAYAYAEYQRGNANVLSELGEALMMQLNHFLAQLT